MHLPGIRLIILTALGLVMRFLRHYSIYIFYSTCSSDIIKPLFVSTTENLEICSREQIVGHKGHHQPHSFQFDIKFNSINAGLHQLLSSCVLFGSTRIISFASPSSDTFCFSLPHPSPSHIHGNAEDPITLWLIPSQTQWVYNISTSPTHHRKYSFLMELFWSS